MLKRIALIRVVSLILLAVGEALCQKSASDDLLPGLPFDGSGFLQVQRPEMRAWSSLPDAPSLMQRRRQAEKFPAFVNETRPPLTFGAVGVSAGAMPGTELGRAIAGPQPNLVAHYQLVFTRKEPNDFLSQYLHQPMLKLDTRYYASTSDSLMGRASYAASRMFVTRDHFGKARLNTSYFLGVLTSVASAAAHRPSWTRSTAGTFNNFGSTIGGDAGLNLFHEFEPGIRQMVEGHAPKFATRIAERLGHGMAKSAVIIPAK
jgi:hypothetical protein